MRQIGLLLVGLCLFCVPILAQDFVLLDTLIQTDTLPIHSYNYMEPYYWVPLRITNTSGRQLQLEGIAADAEVLPELAYRGTGYIQPGETRSFRVRIPFSTQSSQEDRWFSLEIDARGNKRFHLRSLQPRPIVRKSPARWTQIRETQFYPLKLTIRNPQDRPLALDSLLYDKTRVDSLFRFDSWQLIDKLPRVVMPHDSLTIRMRIPTEGLFATIGAWWDLHYHWPGEPVRSLPIVHAFAVEPNVWVEAGGLWELDTIRYGDLIEQQFWLTNEGSRCLSLTSEAEQLVWTSTETLCPGDTALGYVRYDTRCDSVGELDLELALFIKEFNGHIPLRFTGYLQADGEAATVGQAYLTPLESVIALGPGKQLRKTVAFYNRSSQTVLIENVYATETETAPGNLRAGLANPLEPGIVLPGDTLQIQYTWDYSGAEPVELKAGIRINYTLEGCPLFRGHYDLPVTGTVRHQGGN